MKIGALVGFGKQATPDLIAATGRAVEEAGLHSLWVPEHVLFFPEYASRYPYTEDGRLPGDPDGVLEPFTALAFLAAHTERIRLGTGICLVPQRHPVYAAKQVADVDFLSGGRVDLGVGIGWLREEFDALGIPWERRAARTRECIAVMKTLWCDEVSRFDGEFFSLPECLQNPKPVQKPHPPVHFGGESDAALARVADVGQGWFGFGHTPESFAERLAVLDRKLAEAGRTRADVTVHATPKRSHLTPDGARAFRDLGADQLILPLLARDADGYARAADQAAALQP
ncbi:MAG: LLM class F420-dependent oxidoreductase [Myxococcota bacterium]